MTSDDITRDNYDSRVICDNMILHLNYNILMMIWLSGWVSEWVSDLISESASESVSESVSGWVNRSVNGSFRLASGHTRDIRSSSESAE